MPVVSSMPKSDQECRTLFGVIPFSFMKERGGPLFMEVDDFLPKRKGKVMLCSRVMTCSSF